MSTSMDDIRAILYIEHNDIPNTKLYWNKDNVNTIVKLKKGKEYYHTTALIKAIMYGKDIIINYLLSIGASVTLQMPDTGYSALHYAAIMYGNPDIMKKIAQKAKRSELILLKDKEGQTVLEMAKRNPNLKNASAILTSNAKKKVHIKF